MSGDAGKSKETEKQVTDQQRANLMRFFAQSWVWETEEFARSSISEDARSITIEKLRDYVQDILAKEKELVAALAKRNGYHCQNIGLYVGLIGTPLIAASVIFPLFAALLAPVGVNITIAGFASVIIAGGPLAVPTITGVVIAAVVAVALAAAIFALMMGCLQPKLEANQEGLKNGNFYKPQTKLNKYRRQQVSDANKVLNNISVFTQRHRDSGQACSFEGRSVVGKIVEFNKQMS